MKKKILKKLKQIKKMADLTGIEGNVYVLFPVSDFFQSVPDWDVWDKTLESITEFPRHKHVFSVTQELSVYVILSV